LFANRDPARILLGDQIARGGWRVGGFEAFSLHGNDAASTVALHGVDATNDGSVITTDFDTDGGFVQWLGSREGGRAKRKDESKGSQHLRLRAKAARPPKIELGPENALGGALFRTLRMFSLTAIWNPQAGGGRPPRQPGQVRKEAAVTGCVRVAVLSAPSERHVDNRQLRDLIFPVAAVIVCALFVYFLWRVNTGHRK